MVDRVKPGYGESEGTYKLPADFEALDQRLIARFILALQIIKE